MSRCEPGKRLCKRVGDGGEASGRPWRAFKTNGFPYLRCFRKQEPIKCNDAVKDGKKSLGDVPHDAISSAPIVLGP